MKKFIFVFLNNHNSFVICTVDSRVWFSFGPNPAGFFFFYHLHARAGKRDIDITLQPSDTLSINSNLRRRVVTGSVPIAKRGHLLRNWVRRPFENNITPLLDIGAMLSVSHYIFFILTRHCISSSLLNSPSNLFLHYFMELDIYMV